MKKGDGCACQHRKGQQAAAGSKSNFGWGDAAYRST